MPTLPRGTVTLLFTDSEGSTRLLQHLGKRLLKAGYQGNTRKRPLRAVFTGKGEHQLPNGAWPEDGVASPRPCCTIACTRLMFRSRGLVCMKTRCGRNRERVRREYPTELTSTQQTCLTLSNC